jgi:Ni/Co efflux regulator RcnB
MNRFSKAMAVPVLALTLCTVPAMAMGHQDDARAQDHHDNHTYVRHNDWKKGQHMRQEDWNRGDRVDDWQTHKLRRPANGQEWREIDGHYVLGNSDGVIVQVVPERHPS